MIINKLMAQRGSKNIKHLYMKVVRLKSVVFKST